MSAEQKKYIETINNLSSSPIYCSNSYYNQKIKNYCPGKRYILGKYKESDYLTVGSNQIIFELDAKKYIDNYNLAKKIIGVLEDKQIPHYIYASGGKGIHIEIWLAKLDIKNKEISNLFSDALSYGLTFKYIRLWFWNLILNEAGIDNSIRGVGKIIDSSCLLFDDLNEKTRLIRVVGGRKISRNKITGEDTILYKTFIPNEVFKKNKPRIIKIKNVTYPAIILAADINESEFGNFLINFIEKKKKLNIKSHRKINLSDKGGYINLNGVQKILKGLKTGMRADGAKILAIAMANDNLNQNEKKNIIKKYVENCSQIGDEFTISEATAWSDWIDSQPSIFWNCSLLENLNLHISSECQFCLEKNKSSTSFLKSPMLLNKIKAVLDVEIIGEDDIKIIIFLLMLSKDFLSKSGTPNWNIPGDPMSQNIILSSDSAAGKSYLTKKILELIGEKDKDYFIISRMTKNAINYYVDQNMDKKIIFIEEFQGLDENTSQLRVWMSEGGLNLETIEKVRNSEGIEVNQKITKKTKGHPVFITNQAEGKIEDQINNRSWILGLDISETQTYKILDYQDKIHKGKFKNLINKKNIIQKAIKQLQPYHFLIPFADREALKIPGKDIRARRDYTKFLTLIKCSAYLHQYQREIVTDENNNQFIICTLDDYEIAKKYATNILGATFSGLTNSQIDLLTFLRKTSWNEQFEINDLMRVFGKTQPYWYGQLKQLTNLGYISVSSNTGKANIYNLNKHKIVTLINLPSKIELRELYKNEYNEIKTKFKSF